AGRLIVQGLPLDQADIQASLQDSVLDVSRLNGALYGGALGGTARVVGGGAPQYNLNVGLNNWQISNFLSAYGGAAEALGNGNANLAVSSGGLSVLDIVRALNGNGGLQINGFDVAVGNGAVQGNVLAGVLGLVANLNQVTSFGQGRGVADLSGSFSVQNGVIAFDPFQIISQFYEGALSGRISLVDWTLDANGSAKLAKTALAGVLGNVVKLPDDLPFSVSGSLDNPQFTIATLPRPEDLAKENIPQVLEQVVPNLIPGGDSAPKIEVPQEAEQLLRGLFGR
ncbi:MAG: AsmA-like C-terminal region-containing protein, partial [Rhodospirillaceae bacterium]